MIRFPALVVVLVLVLPCALWAQSTATINGRVTDQAGGVMPGVTVTVTNTGTGIPRTTVTNEQGLYSVPQLAPGRYNVRAELQGFTPVSRTDVELTSSATLSADFTLGVAQVAETLTVQGQAALVETTQSAVTSSLRVAEVQNLPILNRNFTGLVSLVPGARPVAPHNTNKGAMGISMSFGGSAGRNVHVEVDGLDNRDDIVGGVMQNYTIEGIQEFKLLAHSFGAEHGRAAGAVLQIVSKSGTNDIHGSGFYFGRNDAMTAIDYFPKQQHLPKPPYDRQQFGGSIGGPIKRDKLFFFGAVERVRQNQILTFAERLYNEAVLLQPYGAKPIRDILYPLRDTMYTLKGDYQVNADHAVLVRWAQQRNSQDNDLIVANHPELSIESTDYNKLWSIIASDTWVISNTRVNTVSVQRNSMESATGIPGGLTAPIWPIDHNLTFPSIQTGQVGSTTQQFLQSKIQVKDAFTQQLGSHTLKLGGDMGFYPDLTINLDVNQRGGVTFFDDPSTILGSQAAWAANAGTCTTARYVAGSTTACGPYRQGLQTPGAVASIQQGTRGAGGPLGDSAYVGMKQFGAFIQDDWRVTPRLTLNLGLRYDVALNFYSQSENEKSRTYQALKAIGSPYAELPETPTKDISPRAGFAWDLTGDGRSVLRGGGGLYFDMPSQSNGWTIAIQSKPQLYIAGTLVNTAVGVGQLANYVWLVSPFPSIIPPTPTELPRGGNTTGTWWGQGITDPRSIQAHLGFTRQLGNTTAVSTDYTHVEGRHELRFGGNMQVNPILGPWDPTADPSQYGRRRYAASFGSVLGDPNILGAIGINPTANESRFDEWIVHLEQRGSRVTFQGSYTLSWARGYGGCVGGGGGAPNFCISPVNQDRFLVPEEWGPTLTDERHRVVLSGVFELPYGVQVSPIFQAATGRPYNLIAGRDLNGDGVNSDRYIDPATGQMVGVNSARGDATYNLDARVTKFFDFGSGRRLGVFGEFYNITNRTNFGSYNGNALSVSFQQPTGYFAGLPSSRQLQLGARFTF